MKKSLCPVGLLALLHLASAQNACLSLTTLFPDCAFPCVTSAGSAVGCTVATDLACRCDPTTSRLIQNSAVACVIAACTGSGELASALAAGPSICGCVATAVPDTTTTSEVVVTTTAESTTSIIPPETTTGQPQETTTDSPSTYDNPTNTITSITTVTEPPSGGCDTASPCQASIDAVPDCAEPCLSSAAVTAASCSFDDYACQCSSTAVIQEAAQACVIAECEITGAIQVLSAVGEVCSCVSANPTTPCTETATQPPSETETDVEPTPTDTETGGQTDTPTESPTDTPTTKSSDHSEEPTCTAGTTEDCGPVASTAIPECAQPCFTSAAPSINCGVHDYACQCQEDAQASLSQILLPCVLTACDSGDLAGIITGASSVCACATATQPADECSTTGDVTETGSHTTKPHTTESDHSETRPTVTTPPETTSTCADATTQDCGPVATTAVPSCAHACFSSAAPNVGCGVDDYACQCESAAQASLSQLLIPCVATACDSDQLAGVITGASSVCACASAAPTGGCSPGTTSPGGVDTTTEPKPTTTKTPGQTVTASCVDATTSDCGPVATTAVPSCAHACFSSAAPNVGCGVDDYACQCESAAQASLSQLLIPCVATACDSDQLAGVITGASSVCACATAPASGGSCGGGDDGGDGGSPTTTGGSSEPTGGDDDSSTCVPASITSADCGPVATSAVPSCAHACFSSAAPDVGCAVDDYACQCESEAQASLSQLLIPCVATACDSDQLAGVITGASSVCACATAAPASGDSCGGSGGGGDGNPTTTGGSSKPTGGNDGSGDESTCVPTSITAADCGPVATSAVPSCAHACFSSAAPNVGCAVDDYACQCESEAQESLSQLLVPCVATACDSDELAAVITGASSVCACAQAEPTGGSGCDSGSGGSGSGGSGGNGSGSGGGNGEASITTCVSATKTGSNGSVSTSISCYCVSGGQTITKEIPSPTGKGGSSGGGGSEGSAQTKSGSKPESPSETEPAVVVGSAARFEIGVVAAIFSTFWLIAVAL